MKYSYSSIRKKKNKTPTQEQNQHNKKQYQNLNLSPGSILTNRDRSEDHKDIKLTKKLKAANNVKDVPTIPRLKRTEIRNKGKDSPSF